MSTPTLPTATGTGQQSGTATFDGTVLTSRPSFSGEQPNEQEYLNLAASFVTLSEEGDCESASVLLDKKYAKQAQEDEYCAGAAKALLSDVDLTSHTFDDYRTAGGAIRWENNGVTATVYMSFTEQSSIYVDSVFIY